MTRHLLIDTYNQIYPSLMDDICENLYENLLKSFLSFFEHGITLIQMHPIFELETWCMTLMHWRGGCWGGVSLSLAHTLSQSGTPTGP